MPVDEAQDWMFASAVRQMGPSALMEICAVFEGTDALPGRLETISGELGQSNIATLGIFMERG
ncbi:MAG: hypothetical protein JXQ99_21815 [Hyphomicrobiaceae bacterium]